LGHYAVSDLLRRGGGGRPVRTVGAVTDITGQKQAEEEQRKLATVVAMNRDFIGIATLEGRVIYLNQAAMTLVGLRSIEEACQKTIFDFFADSDRVRVRDDFYKSLLKSGYWSGETRFRHFKTGTPIDVDLLGFQIVDDNGAPLYIATVTRDLTERKRAEAEKKKLEEQLLQARKRTDTMD
jgi:PAS domain S-box-containing protein